LYRAYMRFAESKGWKVEPLSLTENSSGGFKKLSQISQAIEVFSI
jgi:protein subunit release factor A